MKDKLSEIYKTKKYFIVRTSSYTTDGVVIADGECSVLPLNSSDLELGSCVWGHVNKSGIVPHPIVWSSELSKPLLNAAGYKTWKAFMNNTAYVSVALGFELTVVPSRNGGYLGDDGGFHSLVDQAILLSANASPQEIGHAVVEALARCI